VAVQLRLCIASFHLRPATELEWLANNSLAPV